MSRCLDDFGTHDELRGISGEASNLAARRTQDYIVTLVGWNRNDSDHIIHAESERWTASKMPPDGTDKLINKYSGRSR